MDKITSVKNTVKFHVYRHRAKYASAATIIIVVAAFNKLDRKAEWDAFLKEHNLLNEYYLPED